MGLRREKCCPGRAAAADPDDDEWGCECPNVLISSPVSIPVKYLMYISSYALFDAITFSRHISAALTHFTRLPKASGESSRPNSNRVPLMQNDSIEKNGCHIRIGVCVFVWGGRVCTSKCNDRDAECQRDLATHACHCRAPNITHKTLRLPASAKRDDLRAQHRRTLTLNKHDYIFTSHVTRHVNFFACKRPRASFASFPSTVTRDDFGQ